MARRVLAARSLSRTVKMVGFRPSAAVDRSNASKKRRAQDRRHALVVRSELEPQTGMITRSRSRYNGEKQRFRESERCSKG